MMNKLSSNERVRVVVRVRPLNNEERYRGHQNIIQIENEETRSNTLTIWDPIGLEALNRQEFRDIDPSCWARSFTYDHCLISPDNSDEIYQSQEKVYQLVGNPVVNWALDGYNSSVLAYGQTGAGKSFTMMGTEEPAGYGLIPRICFGLFEYFENIESETENECSMEFSYLEIYNETIRDCLSPKAINLKVREDPREGTFVTNLTTVLVETFEDVLSLIATGNINRFVAATKANIQSSRSHAIVTLSVKQKFREAPKDGLLTSALRQKLSRIHLVDLAGSERVTNSGAIGIRLREANNINKSLSVLGDVIKSLGENTRSKNPSNSHIPYRNSVLTMVLKHSLGGNSRTVMLAAISPSSEDYEETISTLKYIDNTKKIRLKIAANITSGLSASDGGGAQQLVPILQAEVKKLRELLQQQQIQQSKFPQMYSPNHSHQEPIETLELVDQMRARVNELEEQLKDREELIKSLRDQTDTTNNSVMEDEDMSVITTHTTGTHQSYHSSGTYGTGYGTMRSQPYVVLADDAIDMTLPRLINLNQDPLFSECLVYYIPQGHAVVGNHETEVDILLSGPDILSKHCYLFNDNEEVYILPLHSSAKLYVNGFLLRPPPQVDILGGVLPAGFQIEKKDRYYLRHFDRVSMGRYHLFRFEAAGRRRAMSPSKGQVKSSHDRSDEVPGWDFAHEELMTNKDSTKLAPISRGPIDDDSQDSNVMTFHHSTQKKTQPNRRHHNVEPTSTKDSSSSRRPSDDWWEKVNQVAENPTKVNTPAELRAMLRSVVESAEKQFEKAFSTNQLKDFHQVTETEIDQKPVNDQIVTEINEMGRDDSKKTLRSDRQLINSDSTRKILSDDDRRPATVAVEKKPVTNDSYLFSNPESDVPPPPPLISRAKNPSNPANSSLFLPSKSEEVSLPSSNLALPQQSTRIKLASNSVSTVDILLAERKSTTTTSLNSNPSTIFQSDSQPVQTKQRISTGSMNSAGSRYSSSNSGTETSSSLVFEEEASALQNDMLLMQRTLKERLQRYK